MDYKRNKRFFEAGYSRKLTILTICGALLAPLALFVWWYIYYSNFVLLFALIGAAMFIGSLSIRPKAKDIDDQIDTARKAFSDSTAEKLKFPDDFEENSHAVWGFTEGTVEKTLKNGEKYTDRVKFASLYPRRSTLYIRTESLSLIEEGSTVSEYSLPLAGMTIKADETTLCLLITTPEESLTLPVQSVDYPLEEFIEKVERQIKKAV